MSAEFVVLFRRWGMETGA